MGTPTPRFAGVDVEIGGRSYCVPPLSLGALERFWPFVQSLGNGSAAASPMELLAKTAELVHQALKRNYPELTEDDVKEMLDIKNFRQVLDSVLTASGLVAAKKPEGPAAPEATQSP